jgi:hypothetical protein
MVSGPPEILRVMRVTRAARAQRVRDDHAAGRLGSVEAIYRLMRIYPRLNLTPDGWVRLLNPED